MLCAALFATSEQSAAPLNTTVTQSAANVKAPTEDKEVTAVGSEGNKDQKMEVDGSYWFCFHAQELKSTLICS